MASMITEGPGSGKAALSIDVEDWFHAANLSGAITRGDMGTMRAAG